eukprot:Pgem_evm1s16711
MDFNEAYESIIERKLIPLCLAHAIAAQFLALLDKIETAFHKSKTTCFDYTHFLQVGETRSRKFALIALKRKSIFGISFLPMAIEKWPKKLVLKKPDILTYLTPKYNNQFEREIKIVKEVNDSAETAVHAIIYRQEDHTYYIDFMVKFPGHKPE